MLRQLTRAIEESPRAFDRIEIRNRFFASPGLAAETKPLSQAEFAVLKAALQGHMNIYNI
jgi:hypothetical protein